MNSYILSNVKTLTSGLSKTPCPTHYPPSAPSRRSSSPPRSRHTVSTSAKKTSHVYNNTKSKAKKPQNGATPPPSVCTRRVQRRLAGHYLYAYAPPSSHNHHELPKNTTANKHTARPLLPRSNNTPFPHFETHAHHPRHHRSRARRRLVHCAHAYGQFLERVETD